MNMNYLTQQIIWAIQQSEAVIAYDQLLRDMSNAEADARLAWVTEEQSAEWQDATSLVEQLNDDAQEACTQLVADLKASGVDVRSECGSDGDFAILLCVEGWENFNFDTDYVIAGPR